MAFEGGGKQLWGEGGHSEAVSLMPIYAAAVLVQSASVRCRGEGGGELYLCRVHPSSQLFLCLCVKVVLKLCTHVPIHAAVNCVSLSLYEGCSETVSCAHPCCSQLCFSVFV